ncbi:hypothetical protein N9F40_00820 [bacterium]|jgi:hypothetical protein|nr:hypothetical protein [bacterium]
MGRWRRINSRREDVEDHDMSDDRTELVFGVRGGARRDRVTAHAANARRPVTAATDMVGGDTRQLLGK